MESVSNQNFTGDREEFTKVSRVVAEAKSYSHLKLLEFDKHCEELSWNHRTTTPVRNDHGIIERLRLIAQKQTELQNELYVEQKKRHQPYYCNLDRMTSGSRIP